MRIKDYWGFTVSSIVRKKKTSLLVFSILLLSFGFMVLSLSLSGSVDKTNAEYRKSVYGAWYGAIYEGLEEDEDWLLEQPWLEELWTADICGQMGRTVGTVAVGSVDENFFSVSRAQLVEGRMPEAYDEIVADQSFLKLFGHTGAELGDRITLTLRGQDVGVKGSLMGVRPLWSWGGSFVLVGILDDYTCYWDTVVNNWHKTTPPQVILTPEARDSILKKAERQVEIEGLYDPELVHMMPQYYYTVKEGREAEAQAAVTAHMEETRSTSYARKPGFNRKAYPGTVESYNRFYTVLVFIVTVFSVLCVYLLRLQEQVRSFTVFRSIGITRKQLLLLIGMETLLLALPAALLGVLLGGWLTRTVLRLLLFSDSVPVYLDIPWGRLMGAGAAWLLTVLAARLLVFAMAVRAPLTGRFAMERRKSGRLGTMRRALVSLLTLLLCVAMTLTVMLSFVPMHNRYMALNTPRYSVGQPSGISNYYNVPVEPEKTAGLTQLPGIASVDGYAHINGGMRGTLGKMKAKFAVSFPGMGEQPTTLLVIDEDYWEDTFRFGWGGIDREAFHNGDVVLLTMVVDPYLAGQTVTKVVGKQAATTEPIYWETYYGAEGDMDRMPEDGKITLHFNGNDPFTVEAQVGDVQILPYGTNTRTLELHTPYTVVCSHAFLKKVVEGMEKFRNFGDGVLFMGGKPYGNEHVFVSLDRNAEPLVVADVLRRYCEEKGLILGEIAQANAQVYTQELVMLWSSGGCVALVLLFILISTLSLEAEGERRKYSTLRVIGMSKGQVRRETFLRSLKRCLGAVIVGWVIYGGYAFLVEILPEAKEISRALWVWDVEMGRVGVRWYWVALLTAVCIIVPLFVMTRINARLTREEDFHDGFIGD